MKILNKVLWFSRHEMTELQYQDLERIYGEGLEVTQVNKTIGSVSEIEENIKEHHIIAIVAPVRMQQEIIETAGWRPVISCRNKRILTDEGKASFIHDGWFRIRKVDIVTENL